MITEAFFNHICRVCPQTRSIYRFFANGIIIFSTATLFMPLASKRKIPIPGAELQLYLVFTVFFLIPQVKYSVMLL